MFELVEPEDNRYTLAVSSMRKGTWDFVDSIQVCFNTCTHMLLTLTSSRGIILKNRVLDEDLKCIIFAFKGTHWS